MGYFFIYLLIIIINIFAVLFVLKLRRNKANDTNVISDATLVDENLEKPKNSKKMLQKLIRSSSQILFLKNIYLKKLLTTRKKKWPKKWVTKQQKKIDSQATNK